MRNAARRAEEVPSKRDVILDAALERFAHYGFRRTSMEDIAQQAGISRAAVYLHFSNKEDVFRALARRMHERALAEASSAALAPGPAAERLTEVLRAKLEAFFEIVSTTAHARELLDENSRLCGDISTEFRARHLDLLRSVIESAAKKGELAPQSAGLSPANAAEMLLDCAKGIEMSGGAPMTPLAYRRRLAQLVQVMTLGMGGAPATPTRKRKR